jgi:thermitase
MKRSPLPLWILKITLIHLMAKSLAFASADFQNQDRASVSSWAFEQIETLKARELNRSHFSQTVTVAVVDTGVDLKHPALQGQLWTNPEEIPDNGIDDDHNGYIDDIHGWNFVKNNNDIQDRQGHGTHIAGLIAGRSEKFQGLAPESKLMILKYYDPGLSSTQNLKNEIQAFRYAIAMKAHIINFSGGGPGANQDEAQVLRIAEQKQILVIAAAGNDSLDTDRFPYYPASYSLKNILSVSATDALKRLAGFSNYGYRSAQIAAPGENIRSTAIGGGLIELSGTSQATAVVSGLAALVIAQKKLKPHQVIEKIQAGSRFEAPLQGRIAQGGIVSVYRSLAMRSSQETAIEIDDNPTLAANSPAVLVSLDPDKSLAHDRPNDLLRTP